MLPSCRLDLDFWSLVAIQLQIQTLIKLLKGLTSDFCLVEHQIARLVLREYCSLR